MATLSLSKVRHILQPFSRPSIVSRRFVMPENAVLVSKVANAGVIQLNRPNAMNALEGNMISIISQFLNECENDPEIGLVLLKGTGKSFSCGGDLKCLTSTAKNGVPTFYENYIDLMRQVYRFQKPYISLINGIIMGGGCGLALKKDKFAIATEKTILAMPETTIGFYPDSGAAHFFQGSLGMFLGLTGYRLSGADSYHAGLATHYVKSSDLPYIENALCKIGQSKNVKEEVKAILGNFQDKGLSPFSLEPHREEIEKHFLKSSVEEIVDSLKYSNKKFFKNVLEELQKLSPTALKVAFRYLHYGKTLGYDDLLVLENNIAQKFLQSHDFHEGIRALLIEKDKTPRWEPASLEYVSEDIVDEYFELFSNKKMATKI